MRPIFEISHDTQATAVWVHLAGELDLAANAAIRNVVHNLLDDPATAELVVDLAGVTFIESSTVGVIIGCRNYAATVHKPFRVVGAKGRVRDVLDLMGLTAILANPADQ